jgi:polyphenol oxidase
MAHTFFSQIPQTLTDLKKLPQFAGSKFTQMQQVHESDWQEVDSTSPAVIPNVDATITSDPKITLSVKTADCLPILFHHPRPLVGVIHAGRKGTQQQILLKVLTALKNKYQIKDNLSI